MDQPKFPKRRLLLLILLLIIFLTSLFFLVISFQKLRTQLRAKASDPINTIIGNHGLPGDLWSDIVIGQIDFNQSGPDQVVPFKVFNPGGVIIDRSRRPNTVYVYDGGNSRILVHTSLGVCQSDASIKCTTHSDCPGSQCSFTPAKPADAVIGQPSLTGYNACNGDANMQNYPYRSPARADSLCSIPEWQPSPMEGGSFASMAVDKDHNLYVTDFFNNRVLKYLDPVTTDRIADDVWGQTDMAGNKCNLTDADISISNPPPPTASSLCMGRNQQHQFSFVAGVDIDQAGNLWVADSSNHRVLRFPNTNSAISKTADLVFGQPSFTTRGNGTDATQMKEPAALRIDPNSGWLYVADKGNNRVSIFKPPFINGMKASATFGSQFQGPASIDFDPTGSGIWISDADNNMLELWNKTDATIQKVLFKDTYQPNLTCGTQTPNFVCKNPQAGGLCWDNMCDVRGSIGIDSDGNIMVAAKSVFNQDVWRFASPIPPPELGKTISADHRLMYPPDAGYNYPSNKSLWAPRGVVVKNNQLIISDGRKVRFWNNPQDVTNDQAADGFIGVNSFQDSDPWTIQRISADNQNHLWVSRYSTVDVYQLPLVTGAQPIKTAISFANGLPVLGGGQIAWGFHDQFWGIDVDPSGNYLWLTQVEPINRVIRVRDPFTNPIVDVILGQNDVAGTACNRGLPTAQDDTVCYPGAVKLDRLGNVWVSDHSLESHGNLRMLMFNTSLFTNITNTALFAPPASLVSKKMLPWEPAFDSKNRMVVGYNAQGSPFEISRFAGIYNNPIQSLATSILPDMYLKDLFSQAYAATFDENDNLYVADLNRGRVLIYKTLPPAPTISITQPNGNETLTVGQIYTIKWNSTTPSLPKVSLQLISDHNPDTTIVTDIENTGSYNWNVISDNLTTSGAKFKIRATSTSIYGVTVSDDSNDYLFLNHLPTITTSSLPIGQVGQPYIASVVGSDPDSLDKLSMTIEGISNFGLVYTCLQTSSQIQCNISGTPNTPASTPVPILISLSDNHTGQVQKTLSLTIKPQPDLTVSSISRSTSGVAVGLCNSGGPINKTFSYTIAGTRSTSAFPATLGENSCQKFLTSCSSKIDDPCKWPTVTAIVDPGKTVPESNENNNSLVVQLCLPKPVCPITNKKQPCISPTPPAIGWCP